MAIFWACNCASCVYISCSATDTLCLPMMGGGGGDGTRSDIRLRPLKKIKFRPPPPKKKIKYQISHPLKKSNIRYLTPQKNQLSDKTPPKKIKYQISRYQRSTPPPWWYQNHIFGTWLIKCKQSYQWRQILVQCEWWKLHKILVFLCNIVANEGDIVQIIRYLVVGILPCNSYISFIIIMMRAMFYQHDQW